MPIEVGPTIAGLALLGDRVDKATEQIVADALHMFQASGMQHAPVGITGNSTNAPGDLARSISVTGPRGAAGVYGGETGPTTVYGRQRELGGAIYPKTAKALHFFSFGEEIYTVRVFQVGSHYMEKAYGEVYPMIEPLAIARLSEAILAAG